MVVEIEERSVNASERRCWSEIRGERWSEKNQQMCTRTEVVTETNVLQYLFLNADERLWNLSLTFAERYTRSAIVGQPKL